MGNALDYVYEMGKRPNANTNNERSVSNRKIVKKE